MNDLLKISALNGGLHRRWMPKSDLLIILLNVDDNFFKLNGLWDYGTFLVFFSVYSAFESTHCHLKCLAEIYGHINAILTHRELMDR